MNRRPSGSGPRRMPRCVLGLLRVEQEPRAEAADVAVGDPRAVVELEHGSLVARGLVPEPAGHPQMDEQHLSAGEPDDQVLAPPVDRVDALAGQLRCDPGRLVGPRETRIIDPRRRDPPPLELRREPPALGLDLGKLRH